MMSVIMTVEHIMDTITSMLAAERIMDMDLGADPPIMDLGADPPIMDLGADPPIMRSDEDSGLVRNQ